MRKLLVLLGLGLIALSGILFYAEHKKRASDQAGSIHAMEEVLKGQNQALAGRIFEGLGRADRDAVLALQRWKKKAKTRSFLSDTALAEPDAPKWIIVAGRRARAAGVADDALLEDALDTHQRAGERLSLYQAKGKYYLFINGKVDGQDFAAAYSPEAFFASFRSADGIRAWIALKDGTVIYHPLPRFIGSNAANLKPVAAGIRELANGDSSPFARSYLGIDGHETLGAWTPLPSYGLLVGSEWPGTPAASFDSSAYFWFALAGALLGALCFGLSLGTRRGEETEPRLFDESRLDDDALDYLETARRQATQAIELVKERDRAISAAYRERDEAAQVSAQMEGKIAMLEGFQKLLPPTGKQVWGEVCELFASRVSGVVMINYRYSPSSFSLVPDTLHGASEVPGPAREFLRDTRIYLGNPSLIGKLTATESFQKWNTRRQPLMIGHQTALRVYPIQGEAGVIGAVMAVFDERFNLQGELEPPLRLLESMLGTLATFCEGPAHLLQSSNAKGSSRPLESSPNNFGNRPRSS